MKQVVISSTQESELVEIQVVMVDNKGKVTETIHTEFLPNGTTGATSVVLGISQMGEEIHIK